MEKTFLLRDGKMLNIHKLKSALSEKFPYHQLTKIILSEPDEMSIEAFISKVGTWLALLDLEKQQVLNASIQNSKEAKK